MTSSCGRVALVLAPFAHGLAALAVLVAGWAVVMLEVHFMFQA